jgi:exodeoxyribonuclease VII small subunit
MAKASAQPNTPSFEEAIKRLETLVDGMESGDVPLAELLKKYEEGTQLLRLCEAQLKQAELRIEQLKREPAADGSPTLAPFQINDQPTA